MCDSGCQSLMYALPMPRPLDTRPQHKIRVKSLTNEKKRKKRPETEIFFYLKQKIKFEAEKNETVKNFIFISMKTNNLFKLFLYQKEFQLQITFLK